MLCNHLMTSILCVCTVYAAQVYMAFTIPHITLHHTHNSVSWANHSLSPRLLSITRSLLSAFDKIADTLTLVPGNPVTVTRTTFDLEITELDVNSIPESGHGTTFGSNDVNLPKSLFNDYTNNPTISSSVVKTTSLFRGRDDEITIASSVVSVTVLQNEVKNLAEPVMMKFMKRVPVSGTNGEFINVSTYRFQCLLSVHTS